jgi:hypothetical protein
VATGEQKKAKTMSLFIYLMTKTVNAINATTQPRTRAKTHQFMQDEAAYPLASYSMLNEQLPLFGKTFGALPQISSIIILLVGIPVVFFA